MCHALGILRSKHLWICGYCTPPLVSVKARHPYRTRIYPSGLHHEYTMASVMPERLSPINLKSGLKYIFAPLCLAVVIACVSIPFSSRFSNVFVEPQLQIERSWSRNVIKHYRVFGVTTDSTPLRQSSRESVTLLPSTHPSTTDKPEAHCKPQQRIVFIKTHKTGSTTTASVLERFGYLRNLSFAMSRTSHIISNEKLFNVNMAYQVPNRSRHDFDMLVNHVRYNRGEMERAVPGAKYISILRDPVTQLESAFGYFEMGMHMKITASNPFETFMSNPEKYYAMKSYFWTRSRNGMLYDLGFDHRDDENVQKVEEKIDQLSREIDLMMITEHYDESLILLRKLMCWDYDDILYISNGIRSKSHRYKVSNATAQRIRSWSAGDLLLYEHFNRTLWQKIAEYGPSFKEDLAHFRSLESKATRMCVDDTKNNTGDRREDKLTLRVQSKYCEDLLRADVPYTALIRKTMVMRAAQEAASAAAHLPKM